ncbi:hypothetical protein M9Y10_011936 [Tritrichomonas musculus]|uniref:Glycosyltransferase 61 catalytic domain-containing protein n=1 Tax=Tritrichomonas musculus TaxID=1915356 RepID=A0ABR2IBF2_9EUKA
MKISIWPSIQCFVYTFSTISFVLTLISFFERICDHDFDVTILSKEYRNERFGDFKYLRTIKTLQTFDDRYALHEDSTINFVGCCLERQTLVFHLFEQKQVENHFQIAEVNEVFLTGECDVFYNDTLFQFCRLFYNNLQVTPFIPGNITYMDNVLHVYMSNPFQFGTFLFETLSVISLFPQEIIHKCTVILYETNFFILDSLASFGIFEDHIHVKESDEEIYFVHNLYTILPHPNNILNPAAFETMRSYFVRLFELDQKPPTKFAMMTLKGQLNELMNYEAVLNTFNKKHPEIEWIVDGEPDNFRSLLPFYNDIKLFFSCTNKNSILTFMMQKGTVYCEIQGNFFDPLALHVSAYLGHHHIISRIPGMKIPPDEDPYELPLSTASEMLKIALRFLNDSPKSK